MRHIDADKRTKGRKQQHIAVDTMGFILGVAAHSAGIQDRTAARAVLIRLFRLIPAIRKVFADAGHAGKLIARAVGIVKRSEAGKFGVLPKRWIVECAFAWLANFRRLNRDYEVRPAQSEAMIKLAMIHLLLKRITCYFFDTPFYDLPSMSARSCGLAPGSACRSSSKTGAVAFAM